jgi:hypothetical protein
MRSIEGRLHKLETQHQARQPCWSMDVESARTRAAARVRLQIGEMCDAAWYPAVVSARMLLMGDTPDQAAADMDTLQRWGNMHPEALTPDDGTLTRIIQRLEQTA